MLHITIMAIFALGVILSYKVHHRVTTPLGLFSIVWLFVLSVHQVDIIGYYQLTEESMNSIIFMAVSFLIGSFLGHFTCGSRSLSGTEEATLRSYAGYAYMLSIFLVIGIFGIGVFIILRPEDVSTMYSLRLSRSGEGLYRPLRELIFSVSLPCLLTVALASATLHSRITKLSKNINAGNTASQGAFAKLLQKKMLISLVVSIACLLYYDILTLGRINIASIIAILLVAYLITTHVAITSARYILPFIIVSVMVSYFLVRVTVLRDIAAESDTYLSLLFYLTGPLAYYDVAITNINQHEFGRMTFGALESFFLRPYDFIPFIRDFIPFAPYALTERQEYYYITSQSRYNAFGTFMLDGYYDAGIIGVILLSLMLGYFSAYLYNRSNASSEPKLLCICTLIGVWVAWSPLSWAGGFHSLGTVIFWLLILDFCAKRLNIKKQ